MWQGVKTGVIHAIFVWIVTTAIKTLWSKYGKTQMQEFTARCIKVATNTQSDQPIGVRTYIWLIVAPFISMMATPYFLNALIKLYYGRHQGGMYVRHTGGILTAGSTIYGFEICPGDFMSLDGEYYLAVPIWCFGAILYMGFWATSKRAAMFRNYPLATKIKFSMLLLFSSSIFGAATLVSTLVSGFLGKLIFWMVGNVETNWEFDEIHLQIGVATTVGTAIFIFLILQFFPQRDADRMDTVMHHDPSPKSTVHTQRVKKNPSSLNDDNLIDFD